MKLRTILLLSIPVILFGCNQQTEKQRDRGTAWATGSFASNGKRIYFTATSAGNSQITYSDGPEIGMMMMGGRLACASCHGTDARGGRHVMHMEVMDAPDIRWTALSSGHHDEEANAGQNEVNHKEYDLEDFRNAVEYGQHPDGDKLSLDMPRWQMNDEDLKDLMYYLQSL